MSTIPERMRQVQALTHEYGDPAAIPEESLAELDYVRFEEEEGVVRLMPAEIFALRAAQGGTAVRRERSESQAAPFEPKTIQVETSGGFGASAQNRDIKNAVDKGFSRFESRQDTGDIYDPFVRWLPMDHPLNFFMDKFGNTAGRRGLYEDRVYIIDYPSLNIGIQQRKEDIAVEINRADPDFPTHSELPEEPVARLLDEAYERSDRVSPPLARKLWEKLELVKSRVADPDELEKVFAERFGKMSVDFEDDYDENAYDADPERYERERANAVPIDETGKVIGMTGTELRIESVGSVLRRYGFDDVAEALMGAETIADVRSVLAASARKNAVSAMYRAEEKQLMAERQGMTGEQEIHEFNVRLHALRGRAKAHMRILHGAQAYFDIPKLYASTMRRQIKDMQDMLILKTESGSIDITLDPRYDPVIDSNPGKVSGDCTNGSPLPFGKRVGAHNVKIWLEGEHKGNIYLLKSRTADGEPVWHLDAIQFPNFAVDWQSFPAKLVEALAPEAEKAGAAFITINREPYHISNYDYISKGFLDYLGARNTGFNYDQMDVDLYEIEPDYEGIETVNVTFPEEVEGHSQFQGMGETQLVLWRNPKAKRKVRV